MAEQTLADRITAHLEQTGQTVAAFAKEAGIGGQTVRDILSGKSQGGAKSLVAINALLTKPADNARHLADAKDAALEAKDIALDAADGDMTVLDSSQAIDATTAQGKLDRLAAAKAEHAALAAWSKTDKTTPRPMTPNVDALAAESNGTAQPKRSKSGGAGTKGGRPSKSGDVVFTRDGKPVIRTRTFTLGYMACECTAKIGGDDVKAIKTSELVALLKTLGVEDPYAAPWEVTLPNGVKVGAVSKDEAERLAVTA